MDLEREQVEGEQRNWPGGSQFLLVLQPAAVKLELGFDGLSYS